MALLRRFAHVRRNLLDIISDFPEDKVDEAVCGEWNIKCVLAHIAGWDKFFAEMARLLRTGSDVPYRGDEIEQWNAALVKERENRTWSEVRDEFAKSGEQFLNEYSSLEAKLWSHRFWNGRKPTPAWVVKHNTEHYQEHAKGIETKR
jgi:uncharacterized damage-inducible protein DinB